MGGQDFLTHNMSLGHTHPEGGEQTSPPKQASFFRPGVEPSEKREEATGALKPGDRIGDFVLVRWIARGGMGQVWVAKQESLQRHVALKLVLPERIEELSLALFEREARAGGRLNHPNIVATYGYGSDAGRAWIAQELVEGSWTLKDSLDELRKSEELPPGYYRATAELFAKLADALQAAHEASVVHRDIKPHNVLITPNDEPKLVDFGLARILDEASLSRTGDFAGTYAYMSPEQVTARRMGIDHRTDIFSLGVVLYELLTLRRPFDGDTTHQVAEQIIGHEPQAPGRVRSQCSKDLGVICLKALQKHPGARYATAAAMAADLRRYLADEPILARPSTQLIRLAKWVRRHPALSLCAATALAGVTGIAIVGLLAVHNGRVAADRAERLGVLNEELKTANLLLEEEHTRAERSTYLAGLSAAKSAALSNNRREAHRLFAHCPEGQRGWEWSHLTLAADRSLIVLEGHTDEVTSLALSPDGSRVASESLDKTFRIWDLREGRPLLTRESHGDNRLLAWSPDGRRIASGGRKGELDIRDGSTGQVLRAFTAHDYSQKGLILAVDWDPSGSRILTGSMDGTCKLWDAEDGSLLKTLTPGGEPKRPNLDLQWGWVFAGAWSPSENIVALGMFDSTVRILDIVQDLGVRTLRNHDSPVFQVLWSPDGSRLMSASQRRLNIWDPEGDGAPLVLENRSGVIPFSNAAWSPSGNRVVSASTSGAMRIWDSTTGLEVNVLVGTEVDVSALGWASGGEIISGARDGRIRIWDPDAGEAVHTLKPVNHHHAVAWSDDGTELFSLRADGVFRTWDPLLGEKLRGIRLAANLILHLGAEDNLRLLTSLPDGRLCVSDATNALATVEGHGGAPLHAAALSPGLDRLATCSDEAMSVWDLTDGSQVAQTECVGEPRGLMWSPDGKTILVSLPGIGVRLWSPEDGRMGEVLPCVVGPQEIPISWLRDGRILLPAEDSAFCMWDLPRGIVLVEFVGHALNPTTFAWNPQETRIASGSHDGTLRIWAPDTGECLAVLDSGEVDALAWSPDGSRLATAGRGGVKVWESELEPAVRWWREEAKRRTVRELVSSLFLEHLRVGPVLTALQKDRSLSDEEREVASRMSLVWNRDPDFALTLSQRAWELVDPDRTAATDVALGLRFAREAVSRSPTISSYLATLAWASFANGQFDAAFASLEQAVELAKTEFEKKRFVESLERLDSMVREGSQAR